MIILFNLQKSASEVVSLKALKSLKIFNLIKEVLKTDLTQLKVVLKQGPGELLSILLN